MLTNRISRTPKNVLRGVQIFAILAFASPHLSADSITFSITGHVLSTYLNNQEIDVYGPYEGGDPFTATLTFDTDSSLDPGYNLTGEPTGYDFSFEATIDGDIYSSEPDTYAYIALSPGIGYDFDTYAVNAPSWVDSFGFSTLFLRIGLADPSAGATLPDSFPVQPVDNNTFQFSGSNPTNDAYTDFGVVGEVDSVNQSTPEPSTWFMLLTGGFLMLRGTPRPKGGR